METVLRDNINLKCEVTRVIHPTPAEARKRLEKDEPLWTMFLAPVRVDNKYVSMMFAGMAGIIEPGDELEVTGSLVRDSYGEKIKFSLVQKVIPKNEDSLMKFFTTNFTGIGQKTAEKIISYLGTDAVDRILDDPACLMEAGIKEKKATDIYNQLIAKTNSIEELQFFAKTGLGPARIAKIKKTLVQKLQEEQKHNRKKEKIDLPAFISENPYLLAEGDYKVDGIGFSIADSVAMRLGFDRTDPKRITAGIVQALIDETDTKGNIWINRESLVKAASSKKSLDIQPMLVAEQIDGMIEEGRLVEEDGRLYLPEYYDLEFEVARRIMSYVNEPAKLKTGNIPMTLGFIEKQKGRTLDPSQRDAIIRSVSNRISIITGGPGTGKTTTLDTALTFLEDYEGKQCVLAAPTGRAAKRMSEQTGREAHTIHALSAKNKRRGGGDPILSGVVFVIDECSMVDLKVLKMALDMCTSTTSIIMVGDVDQLPSIGAGQVLRDMIDSNCIPVSRLTLIHRQSGESHIINAAHEIISGKHITETQRNDFFIAKRDDEETCLASIKNYISEVYPHDTGMTPDEIQVLCPIKRGILGTDSLNAELQALLNPPAESKKEFPIPGDFDRRVFRVGDKVIQTKNNYKIECTVDGEKAKGVFNGEIGKIIPRTSDRDADGDETTVLFNVVFPDGKIAEYDADSMGDLKLAYAITVHKSQGSEFRCVMIPLFSYGMPTLYNRNLLYTAVTRAKEYCCIVGQVDTVNKLIHNGKINKRNTTLVQRLRAGA